MRANVKAALLAAAAVAVAGLFIYLELHAPRRGTIPLGVIFLKFWHLALFGFFWFAVYAAGRGLGRLLFGRKMEPPELAVALGAAATVVLAFALCAVHLAYGWLVKALVVGVAAAGVFSLRRELAAAPARAKRWLEELDVPTAALATVLGVFILPVALLAAEPPFYWDVLTYHLAVPQAYAQAHAFVYLPYNVYASMPLGGSLFYLVPLLWDGLIAAGACHLVVTLVAAALTYRLARRWLEPFYAAIAAAFLILTPIVFSCIAAAHADHFQIMWTVAALVAYFGGDDERATSWRRAAAVGVFLGAALAVKYTALAVAAGFVPIWIYDLARRRTRVREVLITAGVAAALVVPWLVKAYVERGNPVFPMFYGLFGGRDFTAEQAQRLMAWQGGIGEGRGFLDYLLLPYRISVEADSEYGKFMGLYLPFLLPLAALGAALWRRAGRVMAFGWVHLLAWGFGSQQLRFLGSAVPAFGVAAAGALAATDRWTRPGARVVWRLLLVAALAAACFPYVDGVILSSFAGHAYFVGMKWDDYLALKCGFYPAEHFINDQLPPDAKVLLVFTNHTLYLKRAAIYDSFMEASALLLAAEKARDGDDLYRTVKAWGATHVHIYRNYENQTWPYYTPHARDVFYDFINRHGVLLYEDRLNAVYELI